MANPPRMAPGTGKDPWEARASKGSGQAEPKGKRLPYATGSYKKHGSGSARKPPVRLPRAK